MPYKRKYNKKPKYMKSRGAQRAKGFRKMGNTNDLYRNSIPRTLQVATRRNKSQVLRFVSNQTYKVLPGGDTSPYLEENVFLRFSANSIYNLIQSNGSQNQPGTFQPQDPASYGPLVTGYNAEGYSEWDNRYFNFTVLGSRIQVTFEPTGSAQGPDKVVAPSTFYVNLSSGSTSITPSTSISDIVQLPYTKRASIITRTTTTDQSGAQNSLVGSGQGVRLYQNYSAKRFEGVSDVDDNNQLRGQMAGSPAKPSEGSYFTVGMRPTIPSPPASGTQLSPEGILRIKIEYITKLTEPTSTNNVQAAPGVFSSIFG